MSIRFLTVLAKWKAYIRYKGENIALGYDTYLEDAVKARVRGIELVQMDAMGWLDAYEELHKHDPERSKHAEIKEEKDSENHLSKNDISAW